MGRVVASSSTTFSLCISSRASQSFTRPFNPNNRPQPKDGGGIKNIIYTLHTYVRTRLNGLYMKKKKRTRHSFDKHGQKSRGWWRNKLTAVSSVCAPLDTVLYCNTSHKPSRRGREKKKTFYKQMCTIKFCGCHSKLRYIYMGGFASSEFGNISVQAKPSSLVFLIKNIKASNRQK